MKVDILISLRPEDVVEDSGENLIITDRFLPNGSIFSPQP
jgi:hypothetical protein